MIPRLYCPAPLAPGALVDLPEQAAHHARRVLRLGEGDAVTLFNGEGGEYSASIARGTSVRIAAWLEVEREAPLAVTLVQALPAADKMDWVVQKAVELGVARLQPVGARRSVVRLAGERAERRVGHWQQVAVSACEQCGRNRVPEVAPVLDLAHFLGRPVAPGETRLLLAPGEAAGLSALARPAAGVTLLVGPEGGFDDGEVSAACAAGFRPLQLGPRVLRTETAGLAALAAIMALWGDF
jgi:16S rRNA (uracil1498-N3)-methyltransferase